MISLKQKVFVVSIVAVLVQVNIEYSQAQQYEGNQQSDLDIEAIEQVTGMEGTLQEGEYKLTVPQNDLDVSVDEFNIIPPMGMGSWATFSPTEEGAILMGDIVVQEDEIISVQQALIDHNLKVTALHNHFVREDPSVMYMHIGGEGTEKELAEGVKAVFEKISELRSGDPTDAEAGEVENSLNTERIAEILGHEGDMNRGVFKITIGRPDIDLQAHGTSISTFMGFSTWAAWQGSPENAAVAGDFVMMEDEVEGVIDALVENNIEVVALHNHMIHENPRVFFLHYWGTGSADQLANGLRDALEETATMD